MIFRLLFLFMLSTILSGKSTLTSYEEMVRLLDELKGTQSIKVTQEGTTVEGRKLFLVNLNRSPGSGQWRLLIYAQQHGNEPAGKEALLQLIRDFARNPSILPKKVDLYIIPMVNPDGAEANKRRNGNDYDLNRDHQRLSQPETVALHSVFRRIMPHMAVDCHEFGRDSEDYAEKGWSEWPLIMMDCGNSPILGNEIFEASLQWITGAEKILNRKGVNFSRYYVGNAPPEGELRYSTTEMDDGRNGLGAYGGLSFIIESGVKRNVKVENEDLEERVNAYIELFTFLINNRTLQRKHLPLIEETRNSGVPDFLPVNYFWGNTGNRITAVKVIEMSTGETVGIPTADFVHDLIVKKTVSSPTAYLIPEDKANEYGMLLEKHNIPYDVLDESKVFKIQSYKLSKLETEWDETYSRYGNRQIVERLPDSTYTAAKGSLIVHSDGPSGRRAALHLEPAMLYGLYQYTEFREIVPDGSIIPVYRIME